MIKLPAVLTHAPCVLYVRAGADDSRAYAIPRESVDAQVYLPRIEEAFPLFFLLWWMSSRIGDGRSLLWDYAPSTATDLRDIVQQRAAGRSIAPGASISSQIPLPESEAAELMYTSCTMYVCRLH
jgi:hypothetical protein